MNPNLSSAAVDEMLIQHILTERLIREVFDNPEFVRRNVIAAEVEKAMQAMTSTAQGLAELARSTENLAA